MTKTRSLSQVQAAGEKRKTQVDISRRLEESNEKGIDNGRARRDKADQMACCSEAQEGFLEKVGFGMDRERGLEFKRQ